jgi:hypothetical protein
MLVPLKLGTRSLAVLAAGVVLAAGGTASADVGQTAADPVGTVKDLGGGALYNAGHAVFVVKDLGGGAYYNVSTGALYVAETGSQALVSGAGTGALLLATAVDDGRDALLLVNGTVLLPVQRALGL